MDTPGSPRSIILGITVWTIDTRDGFTRWWKVHEATTWTWRSGYVWSRPAEKGEEDAVLHDRLYELSLGEAVAYSLGFERHREWVEEGYTTT